MSRWVVEGSRWCCGGRGSVIVVVVVVVVLRVVKGLLAPRGPEGALGMPWPAPVGISRRTAVMRSVSVGAGW